VPSVSAEPVPAPVRPNAICSRGSPNGEGHLLWEARCSIEGIAVPLSDLALWVGFRNESSRDRYWVPASLAVHHQVILDGAAAHGSPPFYGPIEYPARPTFTLLLPGDATGRWIDYGRHAVPVPQTDEVWTVVARFRLAGAPPAPPGAVLVPDQMASAPLTIAVVE
jgi:hypothetical protein